MTKTILFITLSFLLVRAFTIIVYQDTYYFYGMVNNQFSIAEAAYNGKWGYQDQTLANNVQVDANYKNQYIPLEEWKNYKKGGSYSPLWANDLPGFGYLIALTSQLFSDHLTSKYAFAFQILCELIALLLFTFCISLVFGEKLALWTGLLYVFTYWAIAPLASQPMRDIFVINVYCFYITAFFIFWFKKGWLPNLLSIVLLCFAALFLWLRPSGYYFFFLLSPLVFFLKGKPLYSRAAFFAASILIPLIIFGNGFAKFNTKHYGLKNTDFIGRVLWQGMGVIENNPYGFKMDDSSLVPWLETKGNQVDFGTPEMNALLGNYARETMKQDPSFYIQAAFRRFLLLIKKPIEIIAPISFVGFKDSGLSVVEFAKRHPKDFSFKASNRIYSLGFFYLGLISLIIMFYKTQGKRLAILILVSPLMYTLISQILIHFESRYMATGVWVLSFPLAWGVLKISENYREQKIFNSQLGSGVLVGGPHRNL